MQNHPVAAIGTPTATIILQPSARRGAFQIKGRAVPVHRTRQVVYAREVVWG